MLPDVRCADVVCCFSLGYVLFFVVVCFCSGVVCGSLVYVVVCCCAMFVVPCGCSLLAVVVCCCLLFAWCWLVLFVVVCGRLLLCVVMVCGVSLLVVVHRWFLLVVAGCC